MTKLSPDVFIITISLKNVFKTKACALSSWQIWINQRRFSIAKAVAVSQKLELKQFWKSILVRFLQRQAKVNLIPLELELKRVFVF